MIFKYFYIWLLLCSPALLFSQSNNIPIQSSGKINASSELATDNANARGFNYTISDFSMSLNRLSEGSTCRISSTIQNTGNIISESTSISFYLSKDTIYDSKDTFWTSQLIYSLSAGNSRSDTVDYQFISGPKKGNFYVLCIVDENDHIQEINENDNLEYLVVEVIPPIRKSKKSRFL